MKQDAPTLKRVALCQESDCRKRGSKALARLLGEEIEAHGLGDRVETRRSGHHDLCDQAPRLAVQPDRMWYANVTPTAFIKVIDQHLSGGEPVCAWVAQDRSCGHGGKTPRKQRKAR